MSTVKNRPLAEVPLIGREDERATLRSTIEKGRIPDTLLITGRAGIGKRRFAFWTAQALLCQEQGAPCGTCADCKLAAGLSHPDLHVYTPHTSVGGGTRDGQIAKVASMREENVAAIRENALFGPAPHGASYYVATVRSIAEASVTRPYRDGGRKVFIITDADRLASAIEAQNALLKMLEEPPEGTHFILTTSAPQKLLDTIRSRATEMSLSPLTEDDVRSILVNAGLEEAQVNEAAPRSEGSVLRALSWMDEEWQEERQKAISWIRAALDPSPGPRLAEVGGQTHSGASGGFASLIAHVRELAYQGGAIAAGHDHAGVDPRLRDLLASLPQDRRPGIQGWTVALDVIAQVQKGVERNGSPQLLTHRLLRGLAKALGEHPPVHVTQRAERLRRFGAQLGAEPAGRVLTR